MFLLDWLRQYREIKQEYTVEKVCESCETLKMQLSLANRREQDLLNKLLTPPVMDDVPQENLKAVLPTRHMPFAVRRAMLEREDREQSKILQRQKREDSTPLPKNPVTVASPADTTTDDLEAELNLVAANRESEATVKHA